MRLTVRPKSLITATQSPPAVAAQMRFLVFLPFPTFWWFLLEPVSIFEEFLVQRASSNLLSGSYTAL